MQSSNDSIARGSMFCV